MIDDSTIGDAARIPGDETQVSARAGVRASTKKTTKKAAKKTAKKTTKKKTAGADEKKTAGADERSRDGRARKKTAKKAAKKAAKPAAATSAVSEAVAPDAAAEPAPPDPPVPDAPPLDDAATGAAATSDGTAPDAAAERSPPAAKRALPSDAARRLGPTPPIAHMPGGAESEDPGGLGGFLALWGPLIIVGFLVLVFFGEDEREVATASGHDVPAPASDMPDTTAGTEALRVSDPAPDPAGAVLARAFGEAGASPLPAASRVAAPWTDSGGAWPAPPGPYRNPGSHELPSGEHWAARASEWAPSADGRGVQGYGAVGNPPPQWVRCEAPYYWCPAPGNPAW